MKSLRQARKHQTDLSRKMTKMTKKIVLSLSTTSTSRLLTITILFLVTSSISAQRTNIAGVDDNKYHEKKFQFEGGNFCTAANDGWIDKDTPPFHCKVDGNYKEYAKDKDVTFHETSLTAECGPNCRPSCLTLMLDLDKLDYKRELSCQEDEMCHCEFIKGRNNIEECFSKKTKDLYNTFPKCYLEEADCLGATVYDDTITYLEHIHRNSHNDITFPDLDHCVDLPNDKFYNRFKDWKLIKPQNVDCEGECFDERKLYFEYCNIVEEDTRCNECDNKNCGTECKKIVEPFPPGWTTFVVSASIPYEGPGVNSECDNLLMYEEETSSACFLQRVEIYYPPTNEDCGIGCPHCHTCPLLSLGDKFGPLEVVGFGHNFDRRREEENFCASCDRREKIKSEDELSCDGLLSCHESVDCYSGESLGVPNFSDNMCSFHGTAMSPAEPLRPSNIIYPEIVEEALDITNMTYAVFQENLASTANNVDVDRPTYSITLNQLSRPIENNQDQGPNYTSVSNHIVISNQIMVSNQTMVVPDNFTSSESGTPINAVALDQRLQPIENNKDYGPYHPSVSNQTMLSISNQTAAVQDNLTSIVHNKDLGTQIHAVVLSQFIKHKDEHELNQTSVSSQTIISTNASVFNQTIVAHENSASSVKNKDLGTPIHAVVLSQTTRPIGNNEDQRISQNSVSHPIMVSNHTSVINQTLLLNQTSESNQSLGAIQVSYEPTNASEDEKEQFDSDSFGKYAISNQSANAPNGENKNPLLDMLNQVAEGEIFALSNSSSNIPKGENEQRTSNMSYQVSEDVDLGSIVSNHSFGTSNNSVHRPNDKNELTTVDMLDQTAEEEVLLEGEMLKANPSLGLSNDLGSNSDSKLLSNSLGGIVGGIHKQNDETNFTLSAFSDDDQYLDEKAIEYAVENNEQGVYRETWGSFPLPLWIAIFSGTFFLVGMCILVAGINRKQHKQLEQMFDSLYQSTKLGPAGKEMQEGYNTFISDDEDTITIEFTDQAEEIPKSVSINHEVLDIPKPIATEHELFDISKPIATEHDQEEVFSPSGRTIGIDLTPKFMRKPLSCISLTPRILSKCSYLSSELTTSTKNEDGPLPTDASRTVNLTPTVLTKPYHLGTEKTPTNMQTTKAGNVKKDGTNFYISPSDCEVPQEISSEKSYSNDCEAAPETLSRHFVVEHTQSDFLIGEHLQTIDAITEKYKPLPAQSSDLQQIIKEISGDCEVAQGIQTDRANVNQDDDESTLSFSIASDDEVAEV